MYTLVSAAVLAADVVRHPHTVRLADTLDRVLGLTAVEAGGLLGPADPAVRSRVLAACERPRPTGVGSGPVAAVPNGSSPDSRPATAGALRSLAVALEGALLGTLADVHALLLRESPLRELAPEQQQVALDAVTAAWAGAGAALSDVQVLVAPWEAALDPVPQPLPERAWTPHVRALLEEVPRRTSAQWAASVHQHRAGRRLGWSDGLHVACRAAWEAGRLHDVARAQLAAARALALTHTGAPPYGAALVLTGAVQAACTADLVAPSVCEGLRAAWEAGAAPSVG